MQNLGELQAGKSLHEAFKGTTADVSSHITGDDLAAEREFDYGFHAVVDRPVFIGLLGLLSPPEQSAGQSMGKLLGFSFFRPPEGT